MGQAFRGDQHDPSHRSTSEIHRELGAVVVVVATNVSKFLPAQLPTSKSKTIRSQGVGRTSRGIYERIRSRPRWVALVGSRVEKVGGYGRFLGCRRRRILGT